MSSQYGELRSISGWRLLGSLGHPVNFNGFCILASLQQRRRSTEVVSWAGTLYIHFRGLNPLTDFCRTQNSLCVQVFCSPSNCLATIHQCYRQDRHTGQWSVSIEQTILEMVAQKTKARFSHLLWHPAWKRREPILILALHKFVTCLLRHLPTYLQPRGPHRPWLVQLFLQGSLLWQSDKPTDSPCYSACNSTLHLCTQYCNAA